MPDRNKKRTIGRIINCKAARVSFCRALGMRGNIVNAFQRVNAVFELGKITQNQTVSLITWTGILYLVISDYALFLFVFFPDMAIDFAALLGLTNGQMHFRPAF
jgi:hypothetical protein